MGVKNSDGLREAHSEMQPAVVQTTQKLSQSKAVYAAVEAISSGGDAELDEAQQRIVASSLQSMQLSGFGLEGEAKAQFNANQMKLAELSTVGPYCVLHSWSMGLHVVPMYVGPHRVQLRQAYSNNLLDATKAFSMTLADPAQVHTIVCIT